MFIRAPNSGRKLLLTCIVAGVMIAILVSCLQFLVAWHKHEVKYDTLITDVQKYLDTYFADLKSTTDRLQPLTLDTCQQANPELTARAAFSMNVRTFVLVKDKKTFCSSAEALLTVLSISWKAVSTEKPSDLMQRLPKRTPVRWVSCWLRLRPQIL